MSRIGYFQNVWLKCFYVYVINVSLRPKLKVRFVSKPQSPIDSNRSRNEINKIIVARNNGAAKLIIQIVYVMQTINKFIDRPSHLHTVAYALNRPRGTVYSPQRSTPRALDIPV